MATNQPLVCFAHGKESGPWVTKITALAEIARRCGYAVDSPDYSHSHDPRVRLQQLLDQQPQGQPLVLAGSSMGGYVSAQACAGLRPAALFLMAPALYFDAYAEEPEQVPELTTVVHGWRDEVVPPAAAMRFAQKNHSQLLMLDAGHTLTEQMPAVAAAFDQLLQQALRSAAG